MKIWSARKMKHMTAADRWRSRDKKAVSPIIATILLVAITVVLAAVLYILVTGLLTSGSKPYTVGFGTASSSNVAGVYYDTIPIASATAGLTTNLFGLKVTNSSNIGEPTAIQTGACTVGSPVTGCTVSLVCKLDCWYAVLVDANSNTLAIYSSSTLGGTASWTTSTQGVSSSNSVVVVMGGDWFPGGTYTITATSLGSSSVSGQTTL